MNLSSMMYRLNVQHPQQQQQQPTQQQAQQQQHQHQQPQQQQTTSVIPSHIILQQQINAANALNASNAAITLQHAAVNAHLLTGGGSGADDSTGLSVAAAAGTMASSSSSSSATSSSSLSTQHHHQHQHLHHHHHHQQQHHHHHQHQQQHQHARHNQHQALPAAASTSTSSSASASVDEKLKLLTTAIKSEPLHEVIALTAVSHSSSSSGSVTGLSSNKNNKNNNHSNNNNNSNNNNINNNSNNNNNNNNNSNINSAVSLTVTAGNIGISSNSSTSTAAAAASAAATTSVAAATAAAAAHLNSSVNSINLVVGVGSNSTSASTSSASIAAGSAAAGGGVAGTSSSNSGSTNGHLVFVPSKRARLDGPEDWISSPSPGSVPSSAPPLSPSPGSQNHSYNANMSNGYASPLSAGSYDPYSPNGKIGRDDLSPSSSLNGYSESCDAKKSKKGPAPRLQEELCLVCGDRASGYHYNALTCEGCKGFFRRSVTKNAVYCCKFGHACEMDMYMRRKCQECRLKKCLAVGMRPECVVPENQCAMKRREKKAQKEKDKQQASPSSVSTTEFIKKEILELMICEPPTHPTCPLLPDELLVANQARNIPSLTINQLAVIYKLIWYQDGYEQPSEEDLKRIMISSPDENESQHDISFRHITEITILTVQLIVEFAKGLPAFTKIPQEDQITLLKACSSEVMMLRMARRYDHASDSIFFANNRSYTRESYKMAGMADNIEDLLHFCRQMFSMKVDNVEYALLTAIVIFSDRPGLEEAELVEAIQSYYIDTLRIYILNRHCGDPKSLVFFAKLLSILTELRTLGNQNAEMCFSLKLKNRKLPKFLEEIWDVHAIPPSVQSHIQAMQAERAALEPSCEAASTSSAAAAACSSSSTSATGASSSTSASSSTTVAPTSSGLNGDDEVRIVGVNTLYGAALTATTPMSTTVTPGLNLMGVSLGQDHHMHGGTHSTVA